jgi:hypothetical protein
MGGRIVLRTGLKPAEEFSVLAHETAHELLHTKDVPREIEKKVCETRQRRWPSWSARPLGWTPTRPHLITSSSTEETGIRCLRRGEDPAGGINNHQRGSGNGKPSAAPTAGAVVPLPQGEKRLAA